MSEESKAYAKLIFYRFIFFKLDPKDLTPPYWINMGAVAITTLGVLTLLRWLTNGGENLDNWRKLPAIYATALA